jgi:hypothetical protein
MNPEKRFGQIEEILADVVIKIDRVVDNQGKILDEVTQQRVDIEALGASGESTARGLANLTVEVQKGFTQTEQQIQELRTEMNQRFDQIINLLQR